MSENNRFFSFALDLAHVKFDVWNGPNTFISWRLPELKDVRAKCFCATLFRANSHTTSCVERTICKIKWTKRGYLATSLALPWFNNLGRSVTPIFRLMDHFLYLFSRLSKKMKKIYRLEVLIFVQDAPWNSVHFNLSFICIAVSNALQVLSFVKALATFGITYATDPLQQIWLRSFASVDSPSIFLTVNPCTSCSIKCANFSKSG